MAYVITDPCISTCTTACVEVCPCDSIHGPRTPAELRALPQGQRAGELAGLQLYIDPDSCISCGACLPECPVGAIYEEDDVPAQWHDAIRRNAAFFR